MRRRAALFVGFATVVLAGVMAVFGSYYTGIMYDGVSNFESQTEAMYYAAQTVTTVGYGNWIPESWGQDSERKDPSRPIRVLLVKRNSFWFMLAGASLFTFIIGLAVNLVTEWVRGGP